ncbi:MAG: hypothetical protein ACE149_06700 [Armatimonadota bacterium]
MRMIYHTGLTPERWFAMPLVEQMANVGSEVHRTISWRDRNAEQSRNALFRALELIDLTVEDPKNVKRLKEILRVREALVDYFMYDNAYGSTDELWEKYFYAFGVAANRIRRGGAAQQQGLA